jgi:hypothetical protein
MPTMLEKLILSMVGNAHPTIVENGARSQLKVHGDLRRSILAS